MDSDSEKSFDKLVEEHNKMTEMVLKEKKENPTCFVSHWDADDDVEDDTEERKSSKEKQFLYASEHGDNETLMKLLSENKNLVNCRDNDGYTPLHRACYEGHLETVKYLISKEANVNARTEEGWTPLHSACFWGQVEVAHLLMHCKNCDINATTNGNQTALHLAAQNSSNLKLFQILLLNPLIDPSIKNNTQETAKDIAFRNFKYYKLFDIADSDINLM